MRLALLSLPLAMLAACNFTGKAEAGSHRAQPQGAGSRQFALSGFDKVSLRGPDDVIVMVGPAAAVRAEGDKAVLDQLEIVVIGTELRVKRLKGDWRWGGPAGQGTAKVTVTLPAIAAASVAGSGDMTIDRVRGGKFAGDIAGSGNLDIGSIAGNAVDLSIAGSGNIVIHGGKTATISGSVAGSGSIDAVRLAGDTASVSVTGSGNAALNARRAAAVSLIGSGNATIRGGAKCTVKKIGSGDVKCG